MLSNFLLPCAPSNLDPSCGSHATSYLMPHTSVSAVPSTWVLLWHEVRQLLLASGAQGMV